MTKQAWEALLNLELSAFIQYLNKQRGSLSYEDYEKIMLKYLRDKRVYEKTGHVL